MKKYKISLCGHFDSSLVGENGQTVRTNNIRKQILNHYGQDKVKCVSTHNWRKDFVSLCWQVFVACMHSEAILLFPNTRSVKLLLPMCIVLKKIFKTKVYYNVIGGWLPRLLGENKRLLKYIHNTDMLFIQTNTLKQQLEQIGVTNTTIFPNFKILDNVMQESEITKDFTKPLPCCFFSRVTEKKGVEDAINAIMEINKEKVKFTFDIYGPIDEKYRERFETILKDVPEYISYKGSVNNTQSVDVLKKYFIQIFPTKYKTEGHPGSLIDSLYAGLPVVAARWNSYADIVKENETGITYEFENAQHLKDVLLYCYDHQDKINNMRIKCLEYSKHYSPETVMPIMYNVFDADGDK